MNNNSLVTALQSSVAAVNRVSVFPPSRAEYIVGSIQDGKLSVAPKPRIHLLYTDAASEAARLAVQFPQKQFVVLTVAGLTQKSGPNIDSQLHTR